MARKFYLKNAPRFITEYTNYKFNEIERNMLINRDIQIAILNNIANMFRYLSHNMISVNEYMRILSDIENYTIDRIIGENETIKTYLRIFNNNTVNLLSMEIHTLECDFAFDTFEKMLTFMENEISLYTANTHDTMYIHNELK